MMHLYDVATADQAVATVTFRPWYQGTDNLWTSKYAELFWLPILGPTALWLGRRVAPQSVVLDAVELSRSLGLGSGVGRNSALMRTLERMSLFHVAYLDRGEWWLRTTLPDLDDRQMRRLPESLRKLLELTEVPR